MRQTASRARDRAARLLQALSALVFLALLALTAIVFARPGAAAPGRANTMAVRASRARNTRADSAWSSLAARSRAREAVWRMGDTCLFLFLSVC